jgi:uncharacterized cupredoxin-like copper-binding protein
MNEHVHPDLLDDEISSIEGLEIEPGKRDTLGWCRQCGSRHMVLCEQPALFFSECAFCGYLLP